VDDFGMLLAQEPPDFDQNIIVFHPIDATICKASAIEYHYIKHSPVNQENGLVSYPRAIEDRHDSII
jgi:hypothetical protein